MRRRPQPGRASHPQRRPTCSIQGPTCSAQGLTARIVVAASADADTEGILTYLAAEAGWRTAAKYDALFERLHDRLAVHPGIGASRPALGRDIRIGIVSPYIVIYRHTQADDTVIVLRGVHSRRRITGRLLTAAP